MTNTRRSRLTQIRAKLQFVGCILGARFLLLLPDVDARKKRAAQALGARALYLAITTPGPVRR